MGLIDDAKAAELAASKVVAELESPAEVEHGVYTKTPTADGFTLELTPNPAPPAEAPAAPAEPPLPPQNE